MLEVTLSDTKTLNRVKILLLGIKAFLKTSEEYYTQNAMVEPRLLEEMRFYKTQVTLAGKQQDIEALLKYAKQVSELGERILAKSISYSLSEPKCPEPIMLFKPGNHLS